MAGTNRAPPAALTLFEALAHEAHSFDFFEVLRRIEREYSELPRLGYARLPQDEPIRLGQPVHLNFPPSTLARLESRSRGGPPRLDAFFLGLLGPHGALPLHLTEYIYNRVHHQNDDSLKHFMDVFHHRMLIFFYRAWADARAVVSRDRSARDSFGQRALALHGRAGECFASQDAMPDDAKKYYSGHLSALPRRPEALCKILQSSLGLPMRVLDFFTRWVELPEEGRWRLGRVSGFSELGVNIIVGGRVFDAQSGIRLVAGPLTISQYETFLPGGSALSRVAAIVRNLVGLEFEWDLNLVLTAEQVPAMQLSNRLRLGWTTWLGTPSQCQSVNHLVLSLKFIESVDQRFPRRVALS